MHNVVMIICVFVVGAAMFATLAVFFRRLRRIEEEFFGPLPHIPMRTKIRNLRYRIRNRIRKD